MLTYSFSLIPRHEASESGVIYTKLKMFNFLDSMESHYFCVIIMVYIKAMATAQLAIVMSFFMKVWDLNQGPQLVDGIFFSFPLIIVN